MNRSLSIRAIALSVGIVSCFSLAANFAAAEDTAFSQKPFTDVSSSSAIFPGVEYLRTRNIIKGYLDGTFKPDRRMNRAEFITLMTNDFFLQGKDNNCIAKETSTGTTVVFFPDVHKDAWYATAVCVGKTRELVHGYPTGMFKPDDSVNVAEAMKVVARVFAIKIDQTSAAPDDAWYTVYANELNRLHAIPASIGGKANYGRPITRGEIVEMIYKLRQTQTNQ